MVNNFRVGCDPEFVVYGEGNNPLNLSLYLPHHGEVGYDHNGRVAEVRPQPATGTFALLRRLQRLIQNEELQRLPARKFRAGAYVPLQGRHQPLGGHIHLDLRPTYDEMGTMDQTSNSRIAALDRVTAELELLDILPRQECLSRRNDGGYGRYGDVRVNGHIEYRTMASWLYDPKIAYLCLTSAKLAAAAPESVHDKLGKQRYQGAGDYKRFQGWMAGFKGKDSNADRALRLLEKGHKNLIVDPDTDFRERWAELGV